MVFRSPQPKKVKAKNSKSEQSSFSGSDHSDDGLSLKTRDQEGGRSKEIAEGGLEHRDDCPSANGLVMTMTRVDCTSRKYEQLKAVDVVQLIQIWRTSRRKLWSATTDLLHEGINV